MIRTDTTISRDCGTESNCVSMYTVQSRVIIDKKSDFQHASSHHNSNFNAILMSKTRKDQHTVVSLILSE